MIEDRALDRLSAQSISFLEALKYHSESIPDKIAVCYLDSGSAKALTYRQLNKCARAVADKLGDSGLCRGDRCMLLADNSAEWILAYLAIMLCGATVIPLDPQTSSDTLEGLVRFSQPRMLLRQKGHAPGFISPAALVEKEPVSIVEALSTSAPRSMFPDRRGVEQAIIFTSGTTGDPKGVVLSEENFLANIRDLLQTGFLNPDMRALAILPFFHAYPFTASLAAPLYGGGTVVLSASPRADDIAQAIKAFHPTHLIAVPRVLRLLVEGIRRKLRDRGIIGRLLAGLMSLSTGLEKRTWLNPVRFLMSPVRTTALGSVRWVISGGARLEPDVAFAIKGLGFRLYEGYGLTETSPVLTINPIGRPRVGSVGVALPSVTLALRNEENGVGEIIARGPSVFLGYFQRPDLTTEAFVDGWFLTGDLGRIDKQGYLWIEGRRNEMLVTEGGKNVHPEELEAIFCKHRFIRECCVFLNKEGDSAPVLSVAVVPRLEILRSEGVHDLSDTIRLTMLEIARALPSYQRPTRVFLLSDELPRTRLGKVRRFMIPALVKGEGRREVHSGEPMGPVEALIAEYLGLNSVRPEQHLEIDLGLDSLARMDLVGHLQEKLRTELPSEISSQAETVGSLGTLFTSPPPGAISKVPTTAWPRMNIAKAVLQILGDGILSVFLKMKVNFPAPPPCPLPMTGPYIIAPNHLSLLDALILRLSLPRGIRKRLLFLSVGSQFDPLPMRLVAWCARIVVMGKRLGPIAALGALESALKADQIVVIFPEGHMSPTGILEAPKPGAFRLAVNALSPVYPVLISGTYGFYSRGGTKHKNPISVTYLDPILPIRASHGESSDKNQEETLAALWLEAMRKASNERSQSS